MKAITQGKWSEGGASQEGLGAIRICAGGFVIADVFFKRDWQHAPERDEAEANARLIAAAPELLAALEIALATIQRLSPPNPYDHTSGTRDVINAAIKKAQP